MDRRKGRLVFGKGLRFDAGFGYTPLDSFDTMDGLTDSAREEVFCVV